MGERDRIYALNMFLYDGVLNSQTPNYAGKTIALLYITS